MAYVRYVTAWLLLSCVWVCGMTRAQAAGQRTVHVVFKTHLDIGFTDLPDRVVEKYIHEYIPQAIKTARAMEKAGGSDRYVWTLGSWLVSEYLELAPPDRRNEFEKAVREGSIAWHAYPFTGVNEILDEGLFRHGLSLSSRLDRRFGRRTIAAILTDVPGDTRSTVHLLEQAGVRLLHVGVNGASAVPDVPPAFVWRDPAGGEVIVLYHGNYGGTTEISGFDPVLHIAFTNDNKGPHTPEQAAKVFADLRAKYPGARVIASTLNAYAEELWAARQLLPVVTAEIGSSWIHSAGTDPKKYASLRALARLRSRWVSEGRLQPGDPAHDGFSTQLILASEHTGGIDEKEHIDFDHWNVDQLDKVRHTLGYRVMERSWADARAYIDRAVRALGRTTFAAEAAEVLASLQPARSALEGYRGIEAGQVLTSEHFEVRLDPINGGIAHLRERRSGRDWADASRPLASVWHESFSEDDYKRFYTQYLRTAKEWAIRDFGKPGCAASGAVKTRREARLVGAWMKSTEQSLIVLAHLRIEEVAPTRYGLPALWEIRYEFPRSSRRIEVALQWFDKKACRLPEAYWIRFAPAGCTAEGWRIVKLGREVSPFDVVARAGRALHGFDRGVLHRGGEGRSDFRIESLDCPVVAPGDPTLLDFHDLQPDLSEGWHFNLFNNKWGTNFPTWYDEDARFRFVLCLD